MDRDACLGSSLTLCRLENWADRAIAVVIFQVFIEQFIASHEGPLEELILDFDGTDDRVHGDQEGRFFHGYHDVYYFLLLYVFCGDQLLVSYLRPSKIIDGARHAWAILALLVKWLRQARSAVRIIFRGDSGFSCCDCETQDNGTGAKSPLPALHFNLTTQVYSAIVNLIQN